MRIKMVGIERHEGMIEKCDDEEEEVNGKERKRIRTNRRKSKKGRD